MSDYLEYDNNPFKIRNGLNMKNPYSSHPIYRPSVFLQIAGIAINHWHIAVDVGLHLFIKLTNLTLYSNVFLHRVP